MKVMKTLERNGQSEFKWTTPHGQTVINGERPSNRVRRWRRTDFAHPDNSETDNLKCSVGKTE